MIFKKDAERDRLKEQGRAIRENRSNQESTQKQSTHRC